MREIVTLQFGQRANYLATHFWNIQESYFTYTPDTSPSIIDHDIHFRPGIGNDGTETYTPRTLIYDLKGGFGNLKRLNALYDDTGSDPVESLWSGRTSTQKQTPIEPAQYQLKLDAGLATPQLTVRDVRYWSDFNRVFFHPRSIVQLNEYELNSQIAPFESWNAGEDLFRDLDRGADLLDRDVRFFAEEADQMQGFQIIAGVDDAWGGFTERYVDALRDEYGKKSIWVWGLDGGPERRVERKKALEKAGNAARTLRGLGPLVDGYVRLGGFQRLPEYVKIENGEWWWSSVIAAAFESVSLPVRVRGGSGVRGSSMDELQGLLNSNGGQVVYEVEASVVDAGADASDDHGPGQDPRDGPIPDLKASNFDMNFTPDLGHLMPAGSSSKTSKHIFSQVETLRKLQRSSNGGYIPLDHEDVLRKRLNDEAIIEQYQIPLLFPELDTLPQHLFDRSTDHTGYSVLSGLSSSAKIKQKIFDLRDLVTRHSRVIEVDEREDMYNDLTEIGDKYNFGWESDEDSGED